MPFSSVVLARKNAHRQPSKKYSMRKNSRGKTRTLHGGGRRRRKQSGASAPGRSCFYRPSSSFSVSASWCSWAVASRPSNAIPPLSHRCIRSASRSETAVSAGSPSASRPVLSAKVTSAAAVALMRSVLPASKGSTPSPSPASVIRSAKQSSYPAG
ncbi:hypothetical protein Pat9b_5088 (plasmid) [Pantoea sp. At-9b]|nr:hypothetical protein Pat9b_5088 [Pantoea sp. At-9b]